VTRLGSVIHVRRNLATPARAAARDGGSSADRRVRVERRLDLLLLLVAVAVLFWKPLTGQGVFLGVDRLADHWPWRAAAGLPVPEPLNLFVGDTIDAWFPAQHLTTEGWREGRMATWYPTVQAGYANATSPMWYPLNLLYLLLPASYAIGLHAAIRVWLGAAGMYLLLREHGASRWAGLLAGPAYALCAFNANWLNWPHTNASLLVPLLFLAAERTLRKRSLLAAAGLAVVAAAMLYAPFPSVAGYAFMALAGYAVLRTVGLLRDGDRAAVRGLALAGAGGAVGVLLAMPYLLPLARELTYLDVGYRTGLSGAHLPLSAMATWLVPGVFGGFSRLHPYFGPLNPVETIQFVGALALPLAVAALWHRRAWNLVACYAAIGAVSLGVVLGPLLPLVERLPVFSSNPNFRLNVITGFAVAALAGFGLDELLERARTRRLLPLALTWVGLGAMVAVLWLASGFLVHLAAGYRSRELVGWAVAQWGRAALVLAGFVLVLVAVRWWRLARPVAGLLLVGMLVLDVGAYWNSVNPSPPRSLLYPETAGIRFLEERLGSDRLVGFSAFPGSSASVHGLNAVQSHAFHAPSWRWAVTALQERPFQSATFTSFTPERFHFQAALLPLLRVRYYVDSPTAMPIGQRIVASTRPDGPVLRLGPGQQAAVRLPLRDGRTTGIALLPAGGDPEAQVTIGVRLGGRGFQRTYALEDARRGALAALSPELRGRGPLEVTVRVTGGEASFRSPDGRVPAVLAFADDPAGPQGVRLVHAGDVTIYQRTGPVAPRAFLAGRVQAGLPEAEVFGRLSQPSADPTAVALLEGPPPAGLQAAGGAVPPGRAEVTADHGEQLEVRVAAARPALLVVTDAWHPGWSATVDGRRAELRKVDGVLRGVTVPAGAHRVVMRYRPPGMGASLPLAGLGLAGLAALALGGLLARRAAQPRDGT
jgi:Bacterial membrane protein YfhO